MFRFTRTFSLANTSLKVSKGTASPVSLVTESAVVISSYCLAPSLAGIIYCGVFVTTCAIAVFSPNPLTIGGCFLYLTGTLKQTLKRKVGQ